MEIDTKLIADVTDEELCELSDDEKIDAWVNNHRVNNR